MTEKAIEPETAERVLCDHMGKEMDKLTLLTTLFKMNESCGGITDKDFDGIQIILEEVQAAFSKAFEALEGVPVLPDEVAKGGIAP